MGSGANLRAFLEDEELEEEEEEEVEEDVVVSRSSGLKRLGEDSLPAMANVAEGKNMD